MKSRNTNDNIDELFDEMNNRNHDVIIRGVNDKTPIVNYKAILSGTREGMKDRAFIKGLKRLKKSEIILLGGVKLSDFAIAALDLLNIEKYVGEDEHIKKYISSNFDF